ncbi:MAG: N-acetyl-D-myo-inositol-2-amino-2-deoxy-alpha-D-glucopyranoside deacetylase [Frankiaceae bacterium]|jgi:N-acetyl-1-D-myo-inositol-2-amino-2-deoxy-alpha-D-glucopyranoside deacetylase|nr:N-acetyl-D-myo-inositol-2-amino-2-deoxy-alpha-D-glucopyranoside deacetylase [Frankiaceae bacterium]
MIDRRLLLVHAHPDDESIATGATMAKYIAEGAQVTLITCTLGEEGEILVPDLVHLGADQEDGLGRHRIGELAAAMDKLGVTDHRFLGGPGRYRDSGMMDTASNERPECFWQADLDEAAGLLADVIREVRPQVVITYDDFGFYGHPDHIQAHRVTMRAVELAVDAADGVDGWSVAKVYANAVPKSVLAVGIEAMRDQPGTPFEGVESIDDLPFGSPDELITTEIDARDYLDNKLDALRAHATQISVDGPFFALSNNLGQKAWGYEHYVLLRGERGPGTGPYAWESDLFAGL